MPDWIAHIFMGLIISEVFNAKKKGIIVLGSLLPDFVVKINLLTAFFHVNDNILFVSRIYHSPIMGLIIPALIIPLFRYDSKKTYILLTTGFMIHLLADSFTRHFNDGMLLFPFSRGFFSFNLFWPEQYWIATLGSILLYFSIRKYKNYRLGVNKGVI